MDLKDFDNDKSVFLLRIHVKSFFLKFQVLERKRRGFKNNLTVIHDSDLVWH